jgi:UDP-N-acetylglucosamine 3-dehydrogenase
MSVAPLPPLSASRVPIEVGRPLRVALVGAGVMGKRHARVFASRAERFELVAVMDVDPRAASELAEACGTHAATREADAIEQADAVVVATPIFAHAVSVRRALARGRHVLVEKPVAGTASEASELVVLAESSGARLFVGHSERFNPVVRALARLVEPASIESIALRRVGNARSRGAGAQEGALVNLGVHDFDLAAYLARSPLALAHATSATAEPCAPAAEDRADVRVQTESGVSVSVRVDQRPDDDRRRRAIAVTTCTHIWEGNLLAPSLSRTCRATGAREAIAVGTEEPLLGQALAFFAALRGGPGVPSEIATGREGMLALLVAERARRAAARPPRGKLGVPERF